MGKFQKSMESIGIKADVSSGKPKNPNSKRILCICRGGASRSVGLRNVLTWANGHDGIAAGFEGNTPETLEMLYNWAEIIIVAREWFKTQIPEKWHYKLRFLELGEDIYFSPHPELYNKCNEWVKTQEDLALV